MKRSAEVDRLSKNEVEFSVFCIENIADYLNINAKDIYELLTVKSSILFDYIVPSYEPLHSQSREYIVREIVDIMKEKGLLQ